MDDLEPLLKGIKVLEIATYIFGPGSAAILADFGADVIKIEAPGRSDPLRYAHKAPPFMPLEFGYIWQQDNRNKRSIGPEPGASGPDILRELGYSEESIEQLSSKKNYLIMLFVLMC